MGVTNASLSLVCVPLVCRLFLVRVIIDSGYFPGSGYVSFRIAFGIGLFSGLDIVLACVFLDFCGCVWLLVVVLLLMLCCVCLFVRGVFGLCFV